MKSRVVPFTAILLILGACGGDGGEDPLVPTTVEVTPSSWVFTAVGQTRQFTAVVRDQNGDVLPEADVLWSSSQPAIVEISSSGLATARGEGATDIEASAGSASANAAVEVSVPAFECEPGGGDALDLGVGEHALVRDPSEFCLHFDIAGATEEYLVGVQSTSSSRSPNAVTEVRVESVTGSGGGDGIAPTSVAGDASGLGSLAAGSRSRMDHLREVHRRNHAEVLRRSLEIFGGLRASGASPTTAPPGAAVDIPPDLQVGETVDLRVVQLDPFSCNEFTEITAELIHKGDGAMWFSDVDNPAGGLTQGDVQELSGNFDGKILATSAEYFGPPEDLDGNDRIVVLFTKELNRQAFGDDGFFVAGFVHSCDLVDRTQFPASNGPGEFFYHIAPDPDGEFGEVLSREEIKELSTLVVAHEFTHIIQFGRRFVLGQPNMATFMAEGQATLAEEVVGHAFTGRAPDQELGFEVIVEGPDQGAAGPEDGRAWYLNAFTDLMSFWGGVLDDTQAPRRDAAPEECTWIADVDADPCFGRPAWYGVTWSFLRWFSDNYGDQFPGGEQEIERRLVNSGLQGFANMRMLSDQVGEDLEDLLGLWSPMLYVDDRIEGLPPTLGMTSWDLFDIWSQIRVELRPTPRQRGFSDFQDSFIVRAPSWEYYLLAGAGTEAAVRVSSPSGSELPSHMQVFVVRVR